MIVQRKALGLSQAELARRAGVGTETINRLEKAGNSADPVTAGKIEMALKMRRACARAD